MVVRSKTYYNVNKLYIILLVILLKIFLFACTNKQLIISSFETKDSSYSKDSIRDNNTSLIEKQKFIQINKPKITVGNDYYCDVINPNYSVYEPFMTMIIDMIIKNVLDSKDTKSDFNDFMEKPIILSVIENTLWKKITMENIKYNLLKKEEAVEYYTFLEEVYDELKEKLKTFNETKTINFNYELYIYEDNEINAIALPGNVILISSGFFERMKFDIEQENKKLEKIKFQKTNKDKKKKNKNSITFSNSSINQIKNNYKTFLQFILLHEITHHLKRHNAFKLQFFLYGNFEAIKKLKTSTSKDNLIDIFSNLVRTKDFKLRFDELRSTLAKKMEVEADSCALKYLYLINNKDPNVYEVVLRFLNDFPKDKKSFSQFDVIDEIKKFINSFISIEVESHLDIHDRVSNINKIILYYKKNI